MEKSSVEQNNYDITPIYDAHIHTYVSRLLDETVWFIKNAMKHFSHKKIMYNALPTYNIADNWVAFYCKANIPDTRKKSHLYTKQMCFLFAHKPHN